MIGCTSGSMIIGDDEVAARIHQMRPEVLCTNPLSAAIAGISALGMQRIALLTPYVDRINRSMRDHLVHHGMAVPVMGSFNHENDNEVARIDAASIADAVLDVGSHASVDAVFVCCTSLRLVEQIETLETKLGKPITSSNHALAWHSLRLAGYTAPLSGFGRLMRR